ncbi:MAG: pilus assembly protein TadG-related protein [Paracoccaceae bacterium]
MDRDMIAAETPSRLSVERFAKDEDGHVIAFTLVMLTLMMMLAGIGVDVMQFETVRTRLQQTLDRATLAAASLTQELDSETVVRDYFAKANLTQSLKVVQFEKNMNSSVVRAVAESEITPIFLNLYDLTDSTKLMASGSSEAEQRINNIEIMMVLDVSGSMAGAKMTNLKTAASEFIDTVLDQDNEGRVSIGIVPYNGQVNLPQYLQNMFTSVDDHGVANVNCFDLPAATYASLGLSRTLGLPVTAHADTYSTTGTGYVAPTNSTAIPTPGNRWCPVTTTNVVRAPTNDRTALKSHINNLQAMGATSINAGMKWGMALLDPSAASIIDGMIAAGQTPAAFGPRPFSYEDPEAMKIVVLMTDGEHFAEERVNDGYRAGLSPIWRHTDGLYSVFQDRSGTTNDYYLPHTNAWQSTPYGGNSAVRQTWPQLWSNLRVSYVARQFFARPNGNSTTVFNNAMDMIRTRTPVATMDAQLQQVCGAAHARDVIVYGIAFEAPTHGQDQIEQCSSSPAHFFNASGLEIRTAFRSIATNISQLKLTQ